MASLHIGEREVREEAEAQLGIPASAGVALELLEELQKSTPSNNSWLLELVGTFYEDLDGRRASGALTHADLMASKRISQLMDSMAFNEGRVTAAELSEKNGIFANVDLTEATIGESGSVADLKGEGADE